MFCSSSLFTSLYSFSKVRPKSTLHRIHSRFFLAFSEMASLCNFILCAPTAVPAGIRSSGSAILCDACLIRWTPPPSSRAKYNLYTTKASASKQYVYPDPDPIFAASETRKFKAELLRTLSKEMETFGNDLPRVVNVCAEVFSDFLHNEYGGPGTLLVEPFTEIMLALKEENLPGAVSAARASLLWAQSNVDQDWKDRNSKLH